MYATILNISTLCSNVSFKKIRGLYSYLIDDIIQTKYPSAPSIRTYVDKTDNSDDERFAVYEWQRQIWVLMNKEQTDG